MEKRGEERREEGRSVDKRGAEGSEEIRGKDRDEKR